MNPKPVSYSWDLANPMLAQTLFVGFDAFLLSSLHPSQPQENIAKQILTHTERCLGNIELGHMMREMFSCSETLFLPGQNFGDLEVQIWNLLLQHSCWQRSFEGIAQAQKAFTCSWRPCWHYQSIHLFHILTVSTSFNNLYSRRHVSLKSIYLEKSLVSKHCVMQFVILYSERGHFARCFAEVGWEIALISRHVWFRGSEWCSHRRKWGENPSSQCWDTASQPLKLDTSLPKSDIVIGEVARRYLFLSIGDEERQQWSVQTFIFNSQPSQDSTPD